jgi:uncharacterized protein
LSSSIVYRLSARVLKWGYKYSTLGIYERFLKEYGVSKHFAKDEWVAVKIHFGSEGAHRVIRPSFIQKTVAAIKEAGGNPFVTDTVRYLGPRALEFAKWNGYTESSLGAPIILADGAFGHDSVLVPGGTHQKEVAIASAIYDAPSMFVLSHVKGHIQSGFGGAIKNLGMGGLSCMHRDKKHEPCRGGIHAYTKGEMKWHGENCTYCELCVDVCPMGALSFDDAKKLVIDTKKCFYCGRCSRVCQFEALEFPIDPQYFNETLAYAAKAVTDTFDKSKLVYINFMHEIQPECDCMPIADVPFVQDQGILISTDPVAIDRAAVDIINSAEPIKESIAGDKGAKKSDDLFSIINPHSSLLQLEYSEKIGMGFQKYEFKEWV